MALVIKREFLKIKPEELGKVFYVGLEQRSPRTVDGKAGAFQRHLVMSDKHGFFNVVTPALSSAIDEDSEVIIENPLFYPDYINGRDIAPAYNVLASKIEIVKGGK